MGGTAGYTSPSDIMDEIRLLVPIYGGIAYSRLNEGGIQWPCPDMNHPGTRFLHQGKFSRGLGKFSVNEYVETDQISTLDYPFILTTGRINEHYHTGTMTRRSWALEREFPHGFMEINPADAERLGLRDRSKVRVISRIGEIITEAHITEKIKCGVVFIPFHFREVAVNKLIGRNMDPVVQIPEYKVCAVKVEEVK
jgi:predicted molibdopterin-dependent oxidoreductase YjgC